MIKTAAQGRPKRAAPITFDDPDHSESEERYLTFGLSLQERLIVVSHTERGDRTRIISARLMGREERVIYEQG